MTRGRGETRDGVYSTRKRKKNKKVRVESGKSILWRGEDGKNLFEVLINLIPR